MSAEYRNEQEKFWAEVYATDYIAKNRNFDLSRGIEAWKIILDKARNIRSVLECGSNIGRNLTFLENVLPEAKKSIIEIGKPSFDFVTSHHAIAEKFNGSILESNFPANAFDLVFTMGVLIHVHPDNLLANMRKMFDYSAKYILIGEYFNRTPVTLEYQGQKDKLFKRDFGKLFIENHDVTLVNYGFLWGHIYDVAGFDDITWWLFEKRNQQQRSTCP